MPGEVEKYLRRHLCAGVDPTPVRLFIGDGLEGGLLSWTDRSYGL
jgi:hypothetical protein